MKPFNVNPALLKGEVILQARNVSKVYGSTHALKGVNFEIAAAKSPRCSVKTAPVNRR